MSNTYKPKVYLLIEWPESNRVIRHPESKILESTDNSNNSNLEGRDCIIPPEIWELYKNSQYVDPDDERMMAILKDNK